MSEPSVCELPAKSGTRIGLPAKGTPAGYTRHRRAGEPPCDDCRRANQDYQASWRAANPDYQYDWWIKNQDRLRETHKRYYLKNKERLDAINRRNYWRNVDERRARGRKWSKDNPEAARSLVNRRRALRAKADGSHSTDEWLVLLELYEGLCAYCSNEATERDHIVPLSKGGSDSIDNIAPACASCNRSKGSKYLWEWVPQLNSQTTQE